MSPFEALMLICFGLSWPFSIARTIQKKQVTGKSPVFLSVVFVGYLFGIVHKVLYSRDIVMGLYILNLIMVFADLMLYVRYSGRKAAG